jgi:hypothetical protein
MTYPEWLCQTAGRRCQMQTFEMRADGKEGGGRLGLHR